MLDKQYRISEIAHVSALTEDPVTWDVIDHPKSHTKNYDGTVTKRIPSRCHNRNSSLYNPVKRKWINI